jgi:sugar lactone lactonase YvrE
LIQRVHEGLGASRGQLFSPELAAYRIGIRFNELAGSAEAAVVFEWQVMDKVELLVDERFELGESPVWDGPNNRVLWADIPARAIHALELTTGKRRVWRFDAPVGSFGLCRSGRWVVSVGRCVVVFDPERGKSTLLAEVDPNPVTRLNDGKVGPDGSFWVGSIDDRGRNREPVGVLYRVTPDGNVERKLDGLLISNGLAWSPDGRTMYHADSWPLHVNAWDFDHATGAISNKRSVRTFSLEEGRPDGAATDVDGFYWTAGITAQCVNRVAPDGNIVATTRIPTATPTMPCFGGSDMRDLFVTSSAALATPEQMARYPLTGAVFRVRVDVAGSAVALFAD